MYSIYVFFNIIVLQKDREELEQRIQQVVLKEEIMQQEQAKLQSEREVYFNDVR